MNADDRTGLLLRERLTDSTAALVARPDTAAQAARGGRRRLRVRQSAFAGMAAALVLAVALPFTSAGALLRQDLTAAGLGGGDRYAPLLHESTDGDLAGDLAGDEAYRQSVFTLWQERTRSLPQGVGGDLRGDPVLAWAGRTEAGPAALVVQRTHLPDHLGLDPADRMSTLVGFIGVDAADEPTLVGYDYWGPGTEGDGTVGWFVDPGRNTLVVRDVGRKLGWNLAEPGRELQKLTFHRGAAIVGVPKGSDPADVQVRRFEDGASNSADAQVARPLLNPPSDEDPKPVLALEGVIPSRVAQPHQELRRALLDAGITVDPGEDPLVAAGRVGGDEILIGEMEVKGMESKKSTAHLYAVALRSGGITSVVDGGVFEFEEGRSIALRLPLDNGWFVAGDGEFRWRSGTGLWNDAEDLGVVPATATALEMTAKNGRRTAVPLP